MMLILMVTVAVLVMATHSMRNMQPRQRKHPKRETQGLKYLNAGRHPLFVEEFCLVKQSGNLDSW